MSDALQSRLSAQGNPLEESSCGMWLGGEAHVGSPVSSPRRRRRLSLSDGLEPLALVAVFVAGLALGVSLAAMYPSSATRKP
ncbi:MAG TPA: hypothetical protein VNK46_13320 [Nitrospiraceae bacterium]|jgi:hypothetical protein|nr:hypothetical protein [Nitrospiraceae bacterium]